MYQFTKNLDVKEFDDFARNHPLGTFFQTSNWSQVKDNWESIYVGLYKDEELVAASLVLKRKVFLNYSMLYAPRGPLIDYQNDEVMKEFFKHFEQLAKEEQAFVFKMDPHVIRNSEPMIKILEEGPDYLDDSAVTSIKENTNFKHAGFLLDMYAAIQPRFEAVVYFDEWWLSNKERTKGYRNSKEAAKMNVKVREIGLDEIDLFESVMNKTEEYKEISLRDANYYRHLKNAFGEECFISVAYLDLENEIKVTKEKIADFDERLSHAQMKRGRRNEYMKQQSNLKEALVEFEEMFEEHGKVIYIAGGLALKSGSKGEFLYAGMDREFAKYNASDIVYTTTLTWAQEQGCELLSFSGINGGLENGLTKYKLTFSPRIDELIGEFSFINKPFINKVFNAANKVRNKLVNRK